MFRKKNLKNLGLALAAVGFALCACAAPNVLGVDAEGSSSSSTSSTSSTPQRIEYPVDYYPSADMSGVVATDSFKWRYVMDITHSYLGGVSSPWINTGAPAIYVLRHLSIEYDGYGVYSTATWQMLQYTGSVIVSASDVSYSWLRESSSCFFSLYNSSSSKVNYDFYNFTPYPLLQNTAGIYGYNRVVDQSAPYGVDVMRLSMGKLNNTQVGFFLTDDNFSTLADMPCTHWLNRMCWDYAQSVVRGNVNQDAAYNYGYSAGKADGNREGYDKGYSAGYAAGESSAQESGVAITNLFGAIATVPISVLNGLSPLVVWGTPVITICVTFLFIGIVLYIVRKFI